ncbi:Mor transcription activator family protein [Janthinobacterium sp. HLX7-2]|uniref:Mor transcription activator family protein n=1 Tax=Janthinobacterium sp. HLX7-2 TaxID=1259331 RepID=UPI003F28C3AA
MYYHKNDIIGSMLHQLRDVLGAEVITTDVRRALEEKLRIEWGGQDVYVKKIGNLANARDEAIRRQYNMCNRRELMEEYGLSRGHFYRIVRGA